MLPKIMSTTFPLDIESIKRYGIENWYSECSIWPVGEVEFKSIYDHCQDLLISAIESADVEIGDLLLVMYKLAIEYSMLLQSNLVVDRLKKRGHNLSYQDSTWYYSAIDRQTDISYGFITRDNLRLWPTMPLYSKRLKGYLGSIKTNFRYQKLTKTKNSKLDKKNFCVSPVYPNYFTQRYAAIKGQNVRVIYPYPQLVSNTNNDNRMMGKIEDATNFLADGLDHISTNSDSRLQKPHKDHVKAITRDSLKSALHGVVNMQKVFRSIDDTDIVLAGLGHTYMRMIAVAARREGHVVVGQSHGTSVSMQDINHQRMGNLGLVDKYIVPTKGAAKLVINSLSKPPLPARSHTVEPISLDTKSYVEIWNQNNLHPPPKSIKTIMFIEYPLAQDRLETALGFWNYQLEILLRISEFCKTMGLRTIVKVHPERIPLSKGLYDLYFDDVVTLPFEQVHQQADAFFMPHLANSPFGLSLLTNKPVFIFEYTLNDVWDQVRNDLRKRCVVLPTWFGEDGRIMFDQEIFAENLTKKPGPVDNDFVKQYMFP
tara:strand:+ start:2319 stop:3941 length:1623 start_codon:yes stop_codon:yes gene_type:complete